jgi:hypothetical protein
MVNGRPSFLLNAGLFRRRAQFLHSYNTSLTCVSCVLLCISWLRFLYFGVYGFHRFASVKSEGNKIVHTIDIAC